MPRPTKTNTLVTMYVNTRAENLSQSNIKDHVWMADSNGDTANNNAGKVGDYVTGAQQKGNITWIAAVYEIYTAPSDAVLITDITFYDDTDQKITISPEPTKTYPTHVNGKITKLAKIHEELGYKIFFTVIRDGLPNLDLYLDPKIRIDPTS